MYRTFRPRPALSIQEAPDESEHAGDLLPLLHTSASAVQNNLLIQHSFIMTLGSIISVENLIFTAISLPELIVISDQCFQNNIPAIINWSKWIAVANTGIAATVGIYNTSYPGSSSKFCRIYQEIMTGLRASVFLMKAELNFLPPKYYEQDSVKLSNLIVFAGIVATSVFTGAATSIVNLSEYKPNNLNTIKNTIKFLAYFSLKTLNTSNTIQLAMTYILDKLNYSSTNYTELCSRYFMALTAAFIIELPRFTDTLSEHSSLNRYLRSFKNDRLPRKIITTLIDLISSFNYAFFLVMLFIQTAPTDSKASSAIYAFDFQVLALMFVVMTPVLAALFGNSCNIFFTKSLQAMNASSNSISDDSDDSDDNGVLPDKQRPLAINDSSAEELVIRRPVKRETVRSAQPPQHRIVRPRVRAKIAAFPDALLSQLSFKTQPKTLQKVVVESSSSRSDQRPVTRKNAQSQKPSQHRTVRPRVRSKIAAFPDALLAPLSFNTQPKPWHKIRAASLSSSNDHGDSESLTENKIRLAEENCESAPLSSQDERIETTNSDLTPFTSSSPSTVKSTSSNNMGGNSHILWKQNGHSPNSVSAAIKKSDNPTHSDSNSHDNNSILLSPPQNTR